MRAFTLGIETDWDKFETITIKSFEYSSKKNNKKALIEVAQDTNPWCS
jgi:hypothetical protein